MNEHERAKRVWDKKGKPGPYDVIVIGSGMGGMTSAAMLAKLGKRVLVLEQHYVPGGFTHTFRRKHYEWDVGVHAVGEVTEQSMTGRLLHHLTDGELKWASLGPVYDEFHYPDGFRIDFPDSPQQFRENLCEACPGESQAIDKYLELVRDVARNMKGYYLAKIFPKSMAPIANQLLARKAQRCFEMSTEKVVNELTENERLRSIFCAQWGYYGSPPSRSSFAIQALVVKHFSWGAYYPEGGSGSIAKCLLKTVADAGGWTQIRADVDEILIQKGRAIGVRLQTGEEITAQKIVSAVGIQSTIQRLMPSEYSQQPWADSIQTLPKSAAHVCLYLGFKGDIRKAGCTAANKWFYNTWDNEQEPWSIDQPDNLGDAAILYCSFPSLKDPLFDAGPEQRHTGEVVTFVPWESFAPWLDTRWQKRGGDYADFKKKLEAKLLEQFLQHVPGLRGMVEYAEISTPLSTDNFVRPMHGAIYGIEPTPDRFRNHWLRARPPVKNLYFSGSELASVGVIGAMMGGVLGACAASPMRAYSLMKKMM
jgi:all-trans-retinol 13,14-reductase